MRAESYTHDASFRTLLDPYEAMFVAVRTPLSQRVVDARIVAATPHAAALFGYDTSTALEDNSRRCYTCWTMSNGHADVRHSAP